MATNWKNTELHEKGGNLPKSAGRGASPAPPHKEYPVHHADHPYMDAGSRIQALEWENQALKDDMRRLNAEKVELERMNRSLRLLAIHGMICRIDVLVQVEKAKDAPNKARMLRLADEWNRLATAYNKLKNSR